MLYLEPTALVSGGGIALLRLVQALDRSRFAPIVLLASHGPLVAEFRRVRGCRVLVREFPPNVARITRSGVFLGALWSSAALARYAAALVVIVGRLRPAITHSDGLKMHLLSAVLRRNRRGALIWHVRDLISPPYMPRRTATLVRVLARAVPDALICNSDATKRTVARRESTRIHRIHDGIVLSGRPREYRSSSPWRRVAILGRVARWKGQDVFVAAALRLLESFRNVRFIVAGAATSLQDAQFLEELRGRVKATSARHGVIIAGLVRNVPKFLSAIDVLVHCSLSPEPFGQVVIEGMAAGLPVVASREGGPSEIITDGKTGFLYPPGDIDELVTILERLLLDPLERKRVGEKARSEVASRFTIENTARSVEDVYNGLLAP
ncbi:MAG: glycosyltransferase family 4 protein [Thermoanaerobaculia bacterium]